MQKIIRLHIVFLILLLSVNLFSQNCDLYFPLESGSNLKTLHFDNKDNLTGSTNIIINEKREIPGGVAIQMTQNYVDIKENFFTSELLVECKNEVNYCDMQCFLDPGVMVDYEGMDIEISADKLTFPPGASPGDHLEDGIISLVIRKDGTKELNMVVQVYDRKIVAEENIETPAGTYNCLKVTYNILSQYGFLHVNKSVVDWQNNEIGTVRSESFNKKGKLIGYSVLQEIN